MKSVPARFAELISKKISIPTMGIGAGVGCDGQVLVTHDVLGLFDRFTPKFVKKYANFHNEMQKAFADYIEDVETKRFPAQEHTVEMDDKEWEGLLKELSNSSLSPPEGHSTWSSASATEKGLSHSTTAILATLRMT